MTSTKSQIKKIEILKLTFVEVFRGSLTNQADVLKDFNDTYLKQIDQKQID